VVVQELRQAVQRVADRARSVHIHAEAIPAYLDALGDLRPRPAMALSPSEATPAAWYWLTLNAINFGSGWFPTLRKGPGGTGYLTISGGLRDRFDAHGPWTARELAGLDAATVAQVMGQDSDHELMARFADSLVDVGQRLEAGYGGDLGELIGAARGSAPGLVELVAAWPSFRDVSEYEGIAVPFSKRAQIFAADLARSGAARLHHLDRLTMFADNLVPHVLRLDGILAFAPELVARIDAGTLIEHGSPEEVEIRAAAVQAVELMVAAGPPGATAARIDELLWQRGQGPRYKGSPRHRSRSTAY
jgi:hypothetical protein